MSAENQKNSNKLYALMLGLISIILTIVPTPDFLENFKPDWTLLLLIFLSINIPKEFNVGTAFILGILVDVSKGTLLGQHAFAYLLVIFLTSKLHLQLRNYPLLQLTAIICLILMIYQFILFWINGVSGISSSISSYMGPVISGTVLWPIISKLFGTLFLYSTSKEKV
ncbi:MAG: rod shape-determining protein MreD [Woeseiaceae bacterium]|jgi:rod shape-determining protein MreD|nr:rod shape-determining protein MreD [Woeseiaceae bacterium]MDG1865621.1 rod shape-determining protein MreD [Woeseiaceae bacterium]